MTLEHKHSLRSDNGDRLTPRVAKCIKDKADEYQGKNKEAQSCEEQKQYEQYVKGSIFSGDMVALTRTEFELLLLRELGTEYTAQTLDYCLSAWSCKSVSLSKATLMILLSSLGPCLHMYLAQPVTLNLQASGLTPVEFHCFITTEDESGVLVIRYILRIWHVFRHTILSIGYIMVRFGHIQCCFLQFDCINIPIQSLTFLFAASIVQGLSFFVASALAIVKWSLLQFGRSPTLFAYTWLYVVGTLVFSGMAFQRVKENLLTKQRVKDVLAQCLQDKGIWKKFKDQGMDSKVLNMLLESSGVFFVRG